MRYLVGYSVAHVLQTSPEKIALTLSGGGLRAIGHLGVMKALEQHHIKPSILSGTSAGAIVAAFYAAGHSPDEMLSIILKKDFFPRSYFRLRTSGLFDPSFSGEDLQRIHP